MTDEFDYMESDGLGKYRDPRKTTTTALDRYYEKNPIDTTVLKKFFSKRPTNIWLKNEDKALVHFKLSNIEFGNGINETNKANLLYASALSLHHLSLALGIKDNQIGLGEKLTLSIGARGHGQPGTHYYTRPDSALNVGELDSDEPLTNTGEFAHEFARAIDNHLGQVTRPQRPFATEDRGTKRTTRKTYDKNKAKSKDYFTKNFEEFFHKLYWNGGKKTAFQVAINNSTSDQINSRREVFARTFEVYILQKLKSLGISNKFLVKKSYRNDNLYPSESLVKQVTPLLDKILKYAFATFKKSAELSGVALGVTGYDGLRKTLKHDGDLDDTLLNMKRIAMRDVYQVEALAEALKGRTVKETCSNIWHYLREHLKYKYDKPGIEELRTPARSMRDGTMGMEGHKGYGIDCDDFTIIVSALLLANKIDHQIMAVAYRGLGQFQHVYPVAFDEEGNRFVIDIVPEIPRFNYEHQPITDQKTIPMQIHELSGLGTSEAEEKADLLEEFSQPFSLSGIEEDLDDEILEKHFLAGFGEVETEEEAEVILSGSEVMEMAEKGLLAEVAKSYESLTQEEKNPTVLSQTINVQEEKEILADLMENWTDPDERDDVLKDAIERKSPFANFYKAIFFSLDQLETSPEVSGVDEIYLARVDMENYEDDPNYLGATRKRRLRNFFKKIGQAAKKGIKAVVRYSPQTIALRNGALLALKTNSFGISEKLIYGYLSETEARNRGLDIDTWHKVVAARQKAEKYFMKLGGKQKNFRNAVIKGRAAKKTGLQLGAIPAFVATIIGLFKKIPFNKLVPPKAVREANKAKRQAKRLAKKNEKSGTDETDEPDETTLPAMLDDGAQSGDENLPVPGEPDNSEDEEGTDDEESRKKPHTGGFMSKIQTLYEENKKAVQWGSLGVFALILGIILGPKIARAFRKKRNQAVGRIKAKQTRAVNQAIADTKKSMRGRSRSKSTGSKKRSLGNAPKPKALPASKAKGKAKGPQKGKRFDLGKMHQIAKQMRKDHPKTKYSVLLGRAAKQLKK